MLQSEILASSNFSNNFNLVPWIGAQPYIPMLLRSFSNMEKCRTNISMHRCSPIQGTRCSVCIVQDVQCVLYKVFCVYVQGFLCVLYKMCIVYCTRFAVCSHRVCSVYCTLSRPGTFSNNKDNSYIRFFFFIFYKNWFLNI